ncbi:MAG: N-acetylmuramoyl-L-alanine amidase [Elusimicrobiota bacterium]|nr:N-acetylmuramoyl-L-alanine amidase [Elusimicrobiota bacterium]
MIRALAAALLLASALSAAAADRPRGGARLEQPRVAAEPPLYPTRSTEPIIFIWPPENMPLAANAEFILGSVSPATAPFKINGVPVQVHRDGGFLAFLPISPGTFTFRGELALSSVTTATAERRILVPLPVTPAAAGELAIDPDSLTPRFDLDLRAGDWLTVRMKGTPGKPARFRVGKGAWQDMRETNAALGYYEGTRQIGLGEEITPAHVEYELDPGWGSAKAKGAPLVSASAKNSMIATVKDAAAGYVGVKTGPANGFLAFPLAGTRLLVTGRENSSLRVRLSESLSGWVDAKDVDLSSGPPPRAVTGTIGVSRTALGAAVKIGVSEKVAFDVEPSPGLDALTVRLYNAVGHTNWAVNDAPDFISEVRWRQEATDVVAVTVILKKGETAWGWWPTFDGASLRLEVRRPPRISEYKPFAGVTIMLDPGHMPSATGSTGPLGTREMDANYAIALAAKGRLQRAGANVLMSRADPLHEVSLVDRPKQAVERGADLFVSIHNNALPDGENPFAKPRGFSIFYYHPQSLSLGRAVHEAYRGRIKLADEGLRWGNLLVARQSAMPAILVENAYMIFPEQEALLNDAAFRDELARALVEGLEKFLRSARRKP